jgi:hypothetical protein
MGTDWDEWGDVHMRIANHVTWQQEMQQADQGNVMCFLGGMNEEESN